MYCLKEATEQIEEMINCSQFEIFGDYAEGSEIIYMPMLPKSSGACRRFRRETRQESDWSRSLPFICGMNEARSAGVHVPFATKPRYIEQVHYHVALVRLPSKVVFIE
jgi:hypothetical protein